MTNQADGDILHQRAPGPAAIQKGISALIVGLNARNPGYRFRVVTSPAEPAEGETQHQQQNGEGSNGDGRL